MTGRTTSLRGSGIRGAIWTLAGHGGAQLVRFASNLVLARLLFPAVFGQAAIVYTFLTGLQLFSDVGTGPSIVQNPRGDDPRFLRTAWTIAAGRGCLLWVASWLVAIPAAGFYGQPSLRWLIPAAAVAALLNGFESTSVHLARRHLRFERLTLMEIGSQVVGSLATIAFAVLGRARIGPNDPAAIWAVVAGGVVYALVRLVLSHTVLPGIRHRLEIDRDAVHSLFHFGRWIFVSTLLTFLAGPSDRLVFGKLIPLASLGVYGIAANLAQMPTEALLKIGSSVVFPTFSRASGRDDFASIFPRVRLPLVFAGALLVSALAASGPFVVSILYDARYQDAGWMLQILSAAAWFQILENVSGAMLLASARPAWMAAGNGAKLLGMFAFIPLGFLAGGFPGALAGLVGAEALRYLVSAAGIRRIGLRTLRLDSWLTAAVAVVAAVGFAAGHAVHAATGLRFPALAAAALPPAIVWGAVGFRLWVRRTGPAVVAAADGGREVSPP